MLPRLGNRLYLQVLVWLSVPLLAAALLLQYQLSEVEQQYHLEVRRQLNQQGGAIQQLLQRHSSELHKIAALLSLSREIQRAFVNKDADLLYQWGKLIIDSKLVDRMLFTSIDGVVIARGHNEFQFGDSLQQQPLGQLLHAESRAGFWKDEGGSVQMVAMVPVYRYEVERLGYIIVVRDMGSWLNSEVSESLESGVSWRLLEGDTELDLQPNQLRVTSHISLLPASEASLDIVVSFENAHMELLKQFIDALIATLSWLIVLLPPLLALFLYRLLYPLQQASGVLNAFAERTDHPLEPLIVELRAIPTANNELRGVIDSVIAALNQLDRTQQALIVSKQQAQQASVAKSNFLASMSHEIRTPMNAILGFSDLLKRTELNARQRHYAETVHQAAANLLKLINDILDLSKIEAGRFDIELHHCSLTALLAELEQLFSFKVLEKGLYFRVSILDSFPEHLYLDQARLRQVLFNLVGNAIKFTEQGGIELVVSAASPATPAQERCIDLSIAVIDSGIGVKEQEQEAIFQNFTQQSGQSHAQYGGTGLGLAISRRLVELMGGA